MDDIINDIKSLKESIEETVRNSRRLDVLLKIFLTSEEIEEVSKLREKQEEYINRMVDIMDFAINGYSDKLVEYPDISMMALELIASRKIVENTEEDIMKIYAAAKERLM